MIYIQDAPVKLVISPSGSTELFVPESFTKEFPALTPHCFVCSDKEFYGPYFQEMAEARLKNHEKEVNNA